MYPIKRLSQIAATASMAVFGICSYQPMTQAASVPAVSNTTGGSIFVYDPIGRSLDLANGQYTCTSNSNNIATCSFNNLNFTGKMV